MPNIVKRILKENGLESRVTVLQGKIEDVVLPVDSVDVIFADWMGYFLFHESYIDDVLYARDKWLTNGGYLFPDKASIYIAGIESSVEFESRINFWDKIYGIDMSIIKRAVISEVSVQCIDKENVITSVCKVFDVNLYTLKSGEINFSSGFELTVNEGSPFNGIVAWFDIYFDSLPNSVKFNTSPFNTPTSFHQCVFYIDEEYELYPGDIIKGSFAFRRDLLNKDLQFKISIRSEDSNYGKEFGFLRFYRLKI
jgi:protein arginine N-methyltransferase 1